MTSIKQIYLFLLKPILMGAIVAIVVLFIFPHLRQGAGVNLSWLNNDAYVPARVSYYNALSRAAPAVVNIYSVSNGLYRNRSFERTNLGSGVMMTENGHLLTCYHVVKGADSIRVALQDSRVLEAQLVGFDEFTDLAVLKVSADNLHVIPQVPKTDIRVGDVVMAVGNPLDLGQTITQGIVSRTGDNGLYKNFDHIQTDAVLNIGNSGGALIDSNGYLMGITNAQFKRLDNNGRLRSVEGVNFAVPYEVAKSVLDDIISYGKVTRRGRLGFDGEEHPSGIGIVVNAVEPDGPADIAGLKVDDVVIALDGVRLESASKTINMIVNTLPGTELNMDVIRNGNRLNFSVTVADVSANPPVKGKLEGA